MPFKSQAQRSAMYAAAEGNSDVGIPQDAAARFIAHSGDASAGGLPEHVAKAPKPTKKKRRLKAKRKKAR